MITTTKNKILSCIPCVSGWMALTGQGTERGYWVGDDEVLTFQSIVERCGWLDAIWALKTVSYGHRDKFLEMADAVYKLEREYDNANKLAVFGTKQKRLDNAKAAYEAVISLPPSNIHLANLALADFIISRVMFMNFHVHSWYYSEAKFRMLELLNKFTSEE